MERERLLAKNLGFDQVIELKPDDFLDFDDSGNPRWQSPTNTNSRNIKPLLDRIDKVIKGINDCCTELAIFINAHQNKSRYITYSNKDVARKPPGKGKKDVTGKINTGILALLVAKQIQASTKAAKLKCQPPAELIFHTCYSGNFADGLFFKAGRLGLGITASSGSNQTTKGRRNGGRAGADEFFFLEALEECLLADPGKTLMELFDCIIRKTRQRSGNTQTPERRPPK